MTAFTDALDSSATESEARLLLQLSDDNFSPFDPILSLFSSDESFLERLITLTSFFRGRVFNEVEKRKIFRARSSLADPWLVL